MSQIKNKYAGTLLGLAIGDALGATLEFTEPGSQPILTEMIGGGAHRLKPGQFTDDTSMALCLAESLLECKGFCPKNQLEKYLKWLQEGYLSSTGTCFDIGGATLNALIEFKHTGIDYCGSTDPFTAGNGSIMRLAPIVIYYHNDLDELLNYAALSSKTTHACAEAINSCKIMALYIAGAYKNMSKSELLSDEFSDFIISHVPDISQNLTNVVKGSYRKNDSVDIEASGYCVKTLEAALWAFYNTNDLESCLIKAVNLCYDADTVGAVAGQIAGAFYGYSEIPKRWIKKLYMHDKIYKLSMELGQR